MKLNSKGINKIHNSYVREGSPDLDQIEFEQSDFDGVVILTLKEAKELKDICCKLWWHGRHPYPLNLFDFLIDKIDEVVRRMPVRRIM